MNFADRLATMFPGDPMLPAMVAACERDDLALAVYSRCEWLQALWTHPTTDKNLLPYLRNPEWPARALHLCREHHVPPPSWAMLWATAVALDGKHVPSTKDKERAERLDVVRSEITEAGPLLNGAMFTRDGLKLAEVRRGDRTPEAVADAIGLKDDISGRLVRVLSDILADTFDAPVITPQANKAGKKRA